MICGKQCFCGCQQRGKRPQKLKPKQVSKNNHCFVRWSFMKKQKPAVWVCSDLDVSLTLRSALATPALLWRARASRFSRAIQLPARKDALTLWTSVGTAEIGDWPTLDNCILLIFLTSKAFTECKKTKHYLPNFKYIWCSQKGSYIYL